MPAELIKTADGSDTLYLQSLDEHYHSTFGAVQESLHVFIKAGFLASTSPHLTLFEAGFGTGLNAWLTFLEAKKTNRTVHYFSLEKYPLPISIVESLNYPDFLHADPEIFCQMHRSPWDEEIELSENFILHKIAGDLKEQEFNHFPKFDLIYFDAFSPEKQPELWDLSVLKKISLQTNAKGLFVTYCAKGSVRRALNQSGFTTERIPGPPGKREMLRGTRSNLVC